MQKSLKRIGVILLAVVVLPALIFSVYEISSLNENEEVIKNIYSNQLETFLFSVNQYSEDVTSSWRSGLNLFIAEEKSGLRSLKSAVDSFKQIQPSVNNIFFFNREPVSFYKILNEPDNNILKFIQQSDEELKKLLTFKRGGYSRIEPLTINENTVLLLFVLDLPYNNFQFAAFEVNSENFVNNILSPKIRDIAGDEFILTVASENKQIFSTGVVQNLNFEQSRNLWLLPEYQLGITLQGETIDNLVKKRSQTNLILVLLLNILIIGGIIIVFRAVRKEIRLAEIKSDFVSNVSHELRTPLALISMFAETLEMGRVKSEEKKEEYYKIIHRETSRLSNIVNKILNFSQIEAGKRKYSFGKYNINEIVNNVFETYQFHLKNNGFTFNCNEEKNLPEIKADKEALTEAIINLLDNAVKYSSDKKHIQISTAKKDNFVLIEIKDSGIGISDEDQKKIFEKFFRVSTGDVHNVKGTGLGLTIIKHIVDAHNGKIELKSSPGKGSTFTLMFPAEK